MDKQIVKNISSEAKVVSVSPDAMRNYILNVAQSLSDEKLLRMLYIRAKNLKAIDK